MRTKTIIVSGDVLTRNGERVSTLTEKVDEAVAAASREGEIVDIKVDTDFATASSGGRVLLVIMYSGNAKESKDDTKAKEDVKQKLDQAKADQAKADQAKLAQAKLAQAKATQAKA